MLATMRGPAEAPGTVREDPPPSRVIRAAPNDRSSVGASCLSGHDNSLVLHPSLVSSWSSAYLSYTQMSNWSLISFIVVEPNWGFVANPRLVNVDGAPGGAFARRQEGGSDA
jgi:hypothetical protein